MTISKKLTAGLMAAAMTLSMATASFAALPADVVDSPYEESIETLGALGIMIGDDMRAMPSRKNSKHISPKPAFRL